MPAIPLPRAGALETLSDARHYILGLPEDELQTTAWHAALALLLVVEHNGPEMFARIGMMRALYPEREASAGSPPKRAKAYGIIND